MTFFLIFDNLIKVKTMKLIKHLLLILTIMALPLLLYRCINVKEKIKLKSDDSGTAIIKYYIPEKLYQNPVSIKKLKAYIPVDEDDLRKIYADKSGVKIKETNTEKTKKGRELSIKLSFDKIENISTDRIIYSLVPQGDQKHLKIRVLKREDKIDEIRTKKHPEEPLDEHDITALLGELLSRFHLLLELHLPAKPIRASGGKIEDKKIIWDVPVATFYKEDKKEIVLEVIYPAKSSLWQRLKEKLGY